MYPQLWKLNKDIENGFTTVEIMVTVLVLGILTAIAIPIFLNAQKQDQVEEVKNNLLAASDEIEAKQLDNGGFYPTTYPMVLRNDTAKSGFVYTYNNARTEYCLEASAEQGKLYVHSGNKTISKIPCTMTNVAG